MNQIAAKHNVSVTAIRPQHAVDDGNLTQIPYAINADGAYKDMMAFERDPQESIEPPRGRAFPGGTADENSDKVTATLTVMAYVVDASSTMCRHYDNDDHYQNYSRAEKERRYDEKGKEVNDMRTTKALSKGFNWKLIFLLVGVGGIVFFMTGSNGDSSTTKANTTSPKSASATTDGYLKEDHDARFASLKIEPRDAFEPLISKATTAKIDPFTISDKLTGGGDWMYTGMVQVNGQSEALLEEQKTGESDYVALGQHWKKARIKRISDSDLELVGDDGEYGRRQNG